MRPTQRWYSIDAGYSMSIGLQRNTGANMQGEMCKEFKIGCLAQAIEVATAAWESSKVFCRVRALQFDGNT